MYFPIEKVLAKRIKRGKVQYRVKWSNYLASENAWVNEEHMYKCENLIRSFERSRFTFIVGINRSADTNAIQYAVKCSDSHEFRLMQTEYIAAMWPNESVDYLKSKIQFSSPVRAEHPKKITHGSIIDLALPPLNVSGCSNLGDQWYFMVDFGIYAKVFTERIAKAKLPLMVLRFLESKIDFGNGGDVMPTIPIRTTRNTSRQVVSLALSVPAIKIDRDVGLEAFLLNTPVARAPPPPTALRTTFQSIPIGARGRRRTTHNLMFIGVKPNLDNRVITATSNTPVSTPTTIPANRTNARLASAPFRPAGNRTQFRLQSTPLAQIATTSNTPVSTPTTIPANRTYARLASTPSNISHGSRTPNAQSTSMAQSTPLAHIDLPSDPQPQPNLDVDYDADFGALRFSDSE